MPKLEYCIPRHQAIFDTHKWEDSVTLIHKLDKMSFYSRKCINCGIIICNSIKRKYWLYDMWYPEALTTPCNEFILRDIIE